MVRWILFQSTLSVSSSAAEGVAAVCRYILVYPQGCDVCNHLSLFLCVADYDKLLPGTHGGSACLSMAVRAVKYCQQWQLKSRCVSCSCCSHRLEPFCSVYDSRCQQRSQEKQVLRWVHEIVAYHRERPDTVYLLGTL